MSFPGTGPRGASLAPAAWLAASLALALSLSAGGLSLGPLGLPRAWTLVLWLAATVLLLADSLRRRETPAGSLRAAAPLVPALAVAALLALMASSLRAEAWYFFLDRRAVVTLALLAVPSALALRAVERRGWGRWLYPLLLLAAQGWLVWALWQTTGGAAVYRDDHPSFLYRFWLLSRSFPRIFLYNPFWNGGYAGTELVSTGALAIGLPGLPLFELLGVERAYTPLLAAIFIVGVPWATWLIMRSLGLGGFPAWAAALLSLGTNRVFFLNLLPYGTAPSLLISFLFLAVWALLFGVMNDGRLSAPRWLALAAALNLMVFWPPSAVMLLPLGLTALISAGRLDRRKAVFLGTVAVFLAAANAWWIWKYLANPRVAQFIAHQGARPGAEFHLAAAFKSLAGVLKQTNPAILVLGFLGLFWPARKEEGIWLWPPVLFLGALIAVGPQLKPQLQLHRMVVPMAFLLLVPAASLLARAAGRSGPGASLLRGAVGAAALLTVLNAGEIYRSRGTEAFWTMTGDVRELVGWIRRNVPEDGRVFFAGTGVHGYGGGHVAWLQAATGRSMIAGDYYHFDPRIRDYNPVPKAYRGSRRKFNEYLKLMGVTHVVTYHRPWKDILRKRSKHFRHEATFGRKEVFSTRAGPGHFLKGSGRVRPAINRLEVTLDPPLEEVVLKFNWLPGLVADPPVELSPVEVAPGMKFIRVRPGGANAFVIRYDP